MSWHLMLIISMVSRAIFVLAAAPGAAHAAAGPPPGASSRCSTMRQASSSTMTQHITEKRLPVSLRTRYSGRASTDSPANRLKQMSSMEHRLTATTTTSTNRASIW